jgi:hypothetical protein
MGYSDESNFGISGDRRTIRVWILPNTKIDRSKDVGWKKGENLYERYHKLYC